jgi:hypothetical protein
MPGLNSIDDLIRRLGGGAARRGTTTSPDALYDASGRSLPMDANGWPAGTEAWGSPARVTADVDPGVMRYLDEMGAKERAWYERFGFDPQSVNPAEGVGSVARRMDSGAPVEPDMGIEGELFGEMYKSAGAYDNLRKGRTTNLRNSGGDLARIAGDNIRRADEAARQSQMTGKLQDDLQKAAVGGALIGGAGGAAYLAMPGTGPQMPGASAEDAISDPSDNAALADETSPVPSVPATPDVPEPSAPKPDYSHQARVLTNQLNAMRKQAMGEVPEAPAMEKEIQRLLDMANAERNAPSYEETLPADYHAQARMLLKQLNEMRAQAGGEVPQAREIMAEVERLQAMGDAQRNGQVTGGPMPQRQMAAPPRSGGMGRAKLPTSQSGRMNLLPNTRSLPRRSSPSTT